MGSGEGSSDPDVVQPPAVAQGDGSGLVDVVVPDPIMGAGPAAGGGGFRPGRVGSGQGAPLQGAVRSSGVVLVPERIQQGLQLLDRGWLL